MKGELSDRIRERAYEMWKANGCREGEAEQDWLSAEREILSTYHLASSEITAKTVGGNLISKASKVRAPVSGRTGKGSASAKALHSAH